MKNKPWIEENDPLKEYYGLLNDNELSSFLSLLIEWNKNDYSLESDIGQVKTGIQLLDFFDYSNESCPLSLFENLCSIMGGEIEKLYWIPLSNNEDIIFQDFSPLMIAKTSITKEMLDCVSRSFMQMLNGGYMFIDSNCRFVGVVIDGYYMQVYMKKDFMDDVMKPYIKNWEKIDEFLDPLLIKDLIDRVHRISR
ncbi:FAD-binding oxidoreductase [Acinetobacter pittii]|uniref:FAD-binding oxidoreductase n=1 Tax=Acinetobacter pittii TaxID=48296 RepID=UPI001D075690|nr:FAD-binding oxidoreductase [Acinetobacter pittii]